VAMWLCGYVATWLFGYVAMWPCLIVEMPCDQHVHDRMSRIKQAAKDAVREVKKEDIAGAVGPAWRHSFVERHLSEPWRSNTCSFCCWVPSPTKLTAICGACRLSMGGCPCHLHHLWISGELNLAQQAAQNALQLSALGNQGLATPAQRKRGVGIVKRLSQIRVGLKLQERLLTCAIVIFTIRHIW
jgi:hypothetical protein